MNLKNFLVGLFRGHSANGELEQVREAARQDVQLMVGTYLQEFQAEAGRLFAESQRHMLGYNGEESVKDAEFEVKEDLSVLSRHELMGKCRERGIGYGRDSTKDDLLAKLRA